MIKEIVAQSLPLIAVLFCMALKGIDPLNVSSAIILSALLLFNYSYFLESTTSTDP